LGSAMPTLQPSITIPGSALSTEMISNKELPVELWTEIFTLATTIPGKDGLSVDGAAYNIMVCDGPIIANCPSSEEISEKNKALLQLIKTCRYWRLIATPLLWSHLRVNIARSPTVIDSVCAALSSNPDLASYIRRLDITFPLDQRSCPSSIAEGIFGQPLPSLKVVICPFPLNPIITGCQPDVVVLETAHFGISQFKPRNGIWTNVRVLRVHFTAVMCFADRPQVVQFNLLENLYIKDKGSSIVWYLVKYWEVPSLRILTIDSSDRRNSTYWLSWLAKVASRLEKLQLNIRADGGSRDVILMPRLRTLYLPFDRSGWIPIKAPSLHRTGYYDIGWPTPEHLNEKAKALIDLFPTTIYLAFRWSFGGISPAKYVEEQVQYWFTQGIQLDLE
jgi:hypothetical protein